MKKSLESELHLISNEELRRLIWEEWESEIKEEDPRQMVFKYMTKMRDICLENQSNKKDKLIIKMLKEGLKPISELLISSEKELKKINKKGFDKEIHKGNREPIRSGLNYTIGYCICHLFLIESVISYLKKSSYKDIENIIHENKTINNLNKKELKRVLTKLKSKNHDIN